MRNTIAAAVLAVALATGMTALAQAQASRGATAAYEAPRGPDRVHPDLNGVWQVLNTANWDVEPHAPRAALQLRQGTFSQVPAKEVLALGAVGAVPGGPGVVDGGTIPYKPEAKALRDENRAKYLERDPEVKCYLPGVPRATYMPYPFQIFQSDKTILIAHEYAGAVRNIHFTDPGEAPVDTWMGQSVGRWDRDTLVVTTTGLNGSAWLDRAGNHTSATLKVTERFTPTGPGTMLYEVRMEDPELYTRPWTMRMNLYKRVGDDARLGQFKCVEFVEELMYGHLRKTPLK
jgi:hypothetical protein